MEEKQIIDYATERGYDGVKNTNMQYNGYDVYDPLYKGGLVYVGRSLWLLVKESEIRMSTPEEGEEIQIAYQKTLENKHS